MNLQQIKVKKNPRKVILLGKGEGFQNVPQDTEKEIWGLNGLLFADIKLDRIFMMDIIDEMPSVVSGLWELPQVIERCNELRIPLVSPYKYDEILTSEAFPIEDAIREFGQPYFNNTIAFMICYALLRGVDEIELYGINQASGTEYFYEKGCVEYWLGIATGMGVRVIVNGKHCELLTNKERYGGNKLYGYNVSYEQVMRSKEKYGDFTIKKLLAPKGNKVGYIGPEKSKSLRTSDILGIRNLWQKFANHPEAKWIVSLNDAYNLARFAIEYKPKRVLDLGTGIGASAAIIKKAYSEADVWSVEQFIKCCDIANELLKSENLEVNVRHSEPTVFKVDGIRDEMAGYSQLPEGNWDMVVIDGPGPFEYEGQLINSATSACGDIFKLVDKINPHGIVYVDGRQSTVNMIQRFLSPYLRGIYKGDKFTVFQRTKQKFGGPLVDGFLEVLKQDKYI
jgi:hypothetical protein